MDYPKWQKLLKNVAEEYSLTEILSRTLEAKFPEPDRIEYHYVLMRPGKLKDKGLTKSGLSDRLTALFDKFDFLKDVKSYKAKALGEYLKDRYKQDPDSIYQEKKSIDNPPNPTPITPIQPPTLQIDWLDRSRQSIWSSKTPHHQ